MMAITQKPNPEDVRVLKELAKLGGIENYVPISSGELAQGLGMSQQTASRRILDLLHKGLIVRRMGMRRQLLRLAPGGVEVLRTEAEDYRSIFEISTTGMAIRGTVVQGLGQGQVYLAKTGYREAFQKLLGFDPHPGTLNLALSEADRAKLEALRSRTATVIPQFEEEGRNYGAVLCYPAQIRGVDCAVVIPERTTHIGILEVVSPHRLRDRLSLRDGDVVEVEPAST